MKFRFPVFVLLAVSSTQAAANVVYYNSDTAYIHAIAPDYYLNTFTGWLPGDPLSSDASYSPPPVNSYQWQAAAAGGLYSLGPSPYLAGITSWVASDNIIFTFDNSRKVTAFGGVFSATDYAGNVWPASPTSPYQVNIAITLASGSIYTLSLQGSKFLGFIATEQIQSVAIGSTSPLSCTVDGDVTQCNYAELSNVYTGEGLVPEPATSSLLVAGLAGLGFGRRRKPRQQ